MHQILVLRLLFQAKLQLISLFKYSCRFYFDLVTTFYIALENTGSFLAFSVAFEPATGTLAYS